MTRPRRPRPGPYPRDPEPTIREVRDLYAVAGNAAILMCARLPDKRPVDDGRGRTFGQAHRDRAAALIEVAAERKRDDAAYAGKRAAWKVGIVPDYLRRPGHDAVVPDDADDEWWQELRDGRRWCVVDVDRLKPPRPGPDEEAYPGPTEAELKAHRKAAEHWCLGTLGDPFVRFPGSTSASGGHWYYDRLHLPHDHPTYWYAPCDATLAYYARIGCARDGPGVKAGEVFSVDRLFCLWARIDEACVDALARLCSVRDREAIAPSRDAWLRFYALSGWQRPGRAVTPRRTARHGERIDWQGLMPSVARALLGEPTSSTSRGDWRYGKRGSLKVDTRNGQWYSHEDEVGGGVVDLVMRVERCDKRGALDWLRRGGLIGR